ncbi:MAG: SsrA-binding protein SmpB [Spiroplasmataceae bacterium]|nr:SsrA-binding protein SmpB [Spiroplasmataceae bacterium]
MNNKVIAQAKKNLHDYKLIERFTAGMVLTGGEIKSLRNHQTSINEAYVLSQQQELYVVNMNVAAYKNSRIGRLSNDPRRKRKLLLKKKEINELVGAMKAKNYVIVPIRLFINERGWAKLEIALAQHLRKYQIKEKVKEKEIERNLRKGNFW